MNPLLLSLVRDAAHAIAVHRRILPPPRSGPGQGEEKARTGAASVLGGWLEGAVLPSAAFFNLSRPLPAAYRLGSSSAGAAVRTLHRCTKSATFLMRILRSLRARNW